MKYDLIIVGGGIVGLSLALALKDSDLSIALVDAKAEDQSDARLFALNATSCQLLANLTIWDALHGHAAPIHEIHVSRQGYFGSVRLKREEVNLPTLGHVIPAHYIESALLFALRSLPTTTIYPETQVKNLIHIDDEVQLTAIDKKQQSISLQASLVIGADGSHSTIRNLLNLPVQTIDYQQSALVTRTQLSSSPPLSRSSHEVAYERFTHNGAIAMLPLKNRECATIWTADTPYITHLMGLSEETFLVTLQENFGYRLGRLQKISARFLYPLYMMQAEKKRVGSVLLVGNAAHTLHPIAAQGLNLALYEIAGIAEKLLTLRETRQKINSLTFDAKEISHQQQIRSVALSHRLAKLFCSRSLIMNTILQIGMVGFDLASPIKKIFIEKILGNRAHSRLLLNMEK